MAQTEQHVRGGMEGVSKTDHRLAHVAVLRVLAFIFCLRVIGQFIQAVFPVGWLPPLSAWQGSKLPYWLLLALQLVILLLMFRIINRHASGSPQRSQRVGKWLLFVGSAYFLVMAARLVVGMGDLSAHVWFHRMIPAVFHLLLALFVLQLAAFHLNLANGKQK